MQGEELNAADVTERGLVGDRAFALVDAADGKVASAKNPRKWLHLFVYRAAFTEPPQPGRSLPPVRLTLPDGTALLSTQGNVNPLVSTALGRTVTLLGAAPLNPVLEEYWPVVEGLAHQDSVTDEAMPAGTFFDCATVHLLTTATLDRLRALYPAGRFEARRFRPNVMVACPAGQEGFVEQGWVGRTLALGRTVRLRVTKPCGRCVMTTLPQADLPADSGILRAAVQHCQGQVGIYASVVQGGTVRRGDVIALE
jgi:uncharacterized protein YcbX